MQRLHHTLARLVAGAATTSKQQATGAATANMAGLWPVPPSAPFPTIEEVVWVLPGAPSAALAYVKARVWAAWPPEIARPGQPSDLRLQSLPRWRGEWRLLVSRTGEGVPLLDVVGVGDAIAHIGLVGASLSGVRTCVTLAALPFASCCAETTASAATTMQSPPPPLPLAPPPTRLWSEMPPPAAHAPPPPLPLAPPPTTMAWRGLT